jgi:hypothetical protein
VALLYLDSFAHQTTTRYQTSNTAAGGFSSTSTRIGPWRVKAVFKKAIPASAEVYAGIGFFWGAAGSILSFWGDAGAVQHVTVMVNSAGKIEVRRGSTSGTLLATGATTIPSAAWFYVEAHVTISDTVGVVQVRLNGAATNEIDFTGDTRNAGTSTNIDAVDMGTTANCSEADWYICDATGTGPANTWLGDTVVRPLVPAGDGDLSQLVGSDGNSVSNWALVDDLPASATDYVGSPTSGAEDAYALGDLPSNATAVLGVQVSATMAKSDTGAASASITARIGGTDYTTGAKTLSTTFQEFTDLLATNPATAAQWTPADVNALQVGMKVT